VILYRRKHREAISTHRPPHYRARSLYHFQHSFMRCDLCLAWVAYVHSYRDTTIMAVLRQTDWSGRRGSNPRLSPWQGDALPLSHSRIPAKLCQDKWAVRDSNSHGSSPTDPKSVLSTSFSNRPVLQQEVTKFPLVDNTSVTSSLSRQFSLLRLLDHYSLCMVSSLRPMLRRYLGVDRFAHSAGDAQAGEIVSGRPLFTAAHQTLDSR
jgi:hypothetical protein